MKVLLTTLNARFIHTSLALAYLAEVAREAPQVEVELVEFSINAHLEDVLGQIFLQQAQVVAFSCYIWNIDLTLKIAANLKKVAPDTKIIFGGPEVSFDPEALMQEHRWLDFVVVGEGEAIFPRLLGALAEHEPINPNQANTSDQLKSIGGVFWRRGEDIYRGEPAEIITSLDLIPSPYQGDLTRFKEQIAYLESSRGCPFNCSYCLSAATKGIRYFSLDRTTGEIRRLMAAGAKQVKFVDRTFNANKEHAMKIWQFIVKEDQGAPGLKTNFHFEIGADLLDEEMLNFLLTVPPGLFQFEIGVQSTNSDTLKAINRPVDFIKLKTNVSKLRQANNIHLHLDLIAGLPYENLASFAQSFNQVLVLKPHRLQLGFLKMLKGAPVREESSKHEYVYTVEAPYQVLANKYISYEELLMLKEIEHLVEKIYNTGQFFYTMDFIFRESPDGFRLFQELLVFWKETEQAIGQEIKQKEIYSVMADFCGKILSRDKADISIELLKIDLLRQQRLTQLPEWAGKKHIPKLPDRMHRFLTDEKSKRHFFHTRTELSFPKLAKQVHFELISGQAVQAVLEATGRSQDLPKELSEDQILLFDYGVEAEPLIGGAKILLVTM